MILLSYLLRLKDVKRLAVLPLLILLPILLIKVNRSAAEGQAPSFGEKHKDYLNLIFFDPSDLYLSYTGKPKHTEHGQPEETDVNSLYFEADGGLDIGNDTFVFADLEYGYRHYAFDPPHNGNRPLDTPERHELSSLMGMAQFITDDFISAWVFYPGISSDFGHDLDSKDFGWSTGPVVSYRLRPRLEGHVGFQVSQDYYDTTVFPLAGFSYFSTDRLWHINLTAPFQYRIGYQASETTELYLSAWYDDTDYHAYLGPNHQSSWVNTTDLLIGPGILWRFTDHLTFTVEGGVSLKNSYRVKRGAMAEVGADSEASPYLTLALGYVFGEPENQNKH
jgi:hypothetical protein